MASIYSRNRVKANRTGPSDWVLFNMVVQCTPDSMFDPALANILYTTCFRCLDSPGFFSGIAKSAHNQTEHPYLDMCPDCLHPCRDDQLDAHYLIIQPKTVKKWLVPVERPEYSEVVQIPDFLAAYVGRTMPCRGLNLAVHVANYLTLTCLKCERSFETEELQKDHLSCCHADCLVCMHCKNPYMPTPFGTLPIHGRVIPKVLYRVPAELSRQGMDEFFLTFEALVSCTAEWDQDHDGPAVTVFQASQENMLSHIKDKFPGHAIFAEPDVWVCNEENPDFVWVLTAINDSKTEITGNPFFGVQIALLYRFKPIMGMVSEPLFGIRLDGVTGRDTAAIGLAICTSPCQKLKHACLYTPRLLNHNGKKKDAFDHLSKKVKKIMIGGNHYGWSLLIRGSVDLVVECYIKAYDLIAFLPIIKGVGGTITDWAGHELYFDFTSPKSRQRMFNVVASLNTALHKEAIKALNFAGLKTN